MADSDKRIDQLDEATSISDNDLLVLESSSDQKARNLKGGTLKNYVYNAVYDSVTLAIQSDIEDLEEDLEQAVEATAQAASDAHDEYLATVAAGTQAVSDIGTAKTSAISDITSAEAAAQAAIASEKTEALAEIDSAVEEVESYAYDIEGLKDTLFNEDSIEGDVIAIEDAAPVNAEKVVVNFEPKQDLHGYNNPWPAGGGKNLVEFELPFTTSTSGATSRWATGFVLPKANTFIRWSAKCSDGTVVSNASMVFMNGSTQLKNMGSGTGYEITSEIAETLQATTGVMFYTSSDYAGKTVSEIQLEYVASASSPTTDYAPYENICPIEGYTGVRLQRTGKNRLDPSTLGLYEVTGTGTKRYGFASILLKEGTYTLSKASGDTVTYITNVTAGYTVETVSEWPFTFSLAADSEVFIRTALTTSSGYNLVDVQLEEGSTATAFEAYQGQKIVANICINQWDEEWEAGAIALANGQNSSSTTKIRSTNYIPVKSGERYYLHINSSDCALFFYDENKTYKGSSYVVSTNQSMSVLISAGVSYMRFSIAQTTYADDNRISFNYPASFTDYFPYTGHGVAYGGTIDLGTGKMVLDMKRVDLGTLTYTYRTAPSGYKNGYFMSNRVSDIFLPAVTEYPDILNEIYKSRPAEASQCLNEANCTTITTGNNGAIAIIDERYGASDVINGHASFLDGVFAVYRMKASVTIQLTPAQLQMLKGLNYVWTDADDMELAYCYVKDGKNAEQLLSKEMTNDQEPYLFRASGGNGADREYDTLVGGTVAWNSIVRPDSYWRVYDSSYSSISVSDHKVTQTIPAGKTGQAFRYAISQIQNKKIPVEHKVFITYSVKTTVASAFRLELNGSTLWSSATVTANVKTAISKIANISVDPNTQFLIYPSSAVDNVSSPAMTIEYNDIVVSDLTAMFGSTIADYAYSLEQATAGSGVAWLKKYGFFTKSYYPYNAGELMSVKATRHKMVGKNLVNTSKFKVGYYITSDGNEAAYGTNGAACSDFLALPVSTYTLTNPEMTNSGRFAVFFYDAQKQYIDKALPNMATSASFTMPSNAYYVRINSITRDLGSVQLEFGSTATAYTPYTTYEYPLDPKVTLQGIYKLNGDKLYCDGDKYYPDKGVERRVRLVDLGSLTWTYQSANTIFIASGLSSMPKINGNSEPPDIWTTTDYVPIRPNGYNATVDKTISLGNSTAVAQVWIRDTSYTDAATFKSAMSGKYLVYYESTSYFEQADPFEPLQVLDPYGTEEYIDDREVPIPVGHDTNYPVNLRAEIERVMKEVPPPPTSNGTYILKVTVASGVPTYSWVAQ